MSGFHQGANLNAYAERFIGSIRRRAEGEAKGRTVGEATLLSKLLTLKFGPLDDATVQRLHGASTTEIERWAARILTADSLDDVFR